MKNLLLVLSISLLTGSAEAGTAFDTDRTFSYDIFNNKELCEAFQREGGNCFQTVNLNRDGKAHLIVTDILNSGTYEIQGDKIIVTMEPLSQVPGITFTLSPNGKHLIEDGTTKVWEEELESGPCIGQAVGAVAKEFAKKNLVLRHSPKITAQYGNRNIYYVEVEYLLESAPTVVETVRYMAFSDYSENFNALRSCNITDTSSY